MLIKNVNEEQKRRIDSYIAQLEKGDKINNNDVIEVIHVLKSAIDTKENVESTNILCFADFLISNIHAIDSNHTAKKLKEAFYSKRIDK